jgi:hypothetical protein
MRGGIQIRIPIVGRAAECVKRELLNCDMKSTVREMKLTFFAVRSENSGRNQRITAAPQLEQNSASCSGLGPQFSQTGALPARITATACSV